MATTWRERFEKWAYGLVSGLIGGAATALTSLAGTALGHAMADNVQVLSLRQLGWVALGGGFWAGVAYLKKSPLPPLEDEGNEGKEN